MQRCAPVLIDAVDIGSQHQQLLDHSDLPGSLVKDGVVEWRAPGVVWHMDQVTGFATQDRKDLHGGVLAGRATSEMQGMAPLEVTLVRVGLVFYE